MKIGGSMKKNKGFTMAEMLGVVVILSIILLIAVPSIINSLKSAEKQEYETFLDDLYLATESYVQHNYELFYPESGTGLDSVLISDLIDKGYLNGNITNPKTGEQIKYENSSIRLSKDENGIIQYEYIYSAN